MRPKVRKTFLNPLLGGYRCNSHRTRLAANRVRLSLFVLAYNLGNFLRRLCLPKAVKHWPLRSVHVKLIKMGGRLVRHSRWLIFQLSEVSVPRRLFQGVLDRIGRLSPAPS